MDFYLLLYNIQNGKQLYGDFNTNHRTDKMILLFDKYQVLKNLLGVNLCLHFKLSIHISSNINTYLIFLTYRNILFGF